jgi:hypothetical protein
MGQWLEQCDQGGTRAYVACGYDVCTRDGKQTHSADGEENAVGCHGDDAMAESSKSLTAGDSFPGARDAEVTTDGESEVSDDMHGDASRPESSSVEPALCSVDDSRAVPLTL